MTTSLLRYLRGTPARSNSAPGALPKIGEVYSFATSDRVFGTGVVLKADGRRVVLRGEDVIWPRVRPRDLGRRLDDAAPLSGRDDLTFARRWLGWPYGHYAAAIALGMPRVPAAERPTGDALWALLQQLAARGVDPLRWDLVREALPDLARLNQRNGGRDERPESTALASRIARALLDLEAPPVVVDPEDLPGRLMHSSIDGSRLRTPEGHILISYTAGDVTILEDPYNRPSGVHHEDVAAAALRQWMSQRATAILGQISPRTWLERRDNQALAILDTALAMAVPAPLAPYLPAGWLTGVER